MRMAVQKLFRVSLLLNVCCIGWFMLTRQQRAVPARMGRGIGTGELNLFTIIYNYNELLKYYF